MAMFLVGFIVGGCMAIIILGFLIAGSEEDEHEKRTRK